MSGSRRLLVSTLLFLGSYTLAHADVGGRDEKQQNLSAVVFGASGATGRQVVSELLAAPSVWGRVVTVSRSPMSAVLPSSLSSTGNLEEIIVDNMEKDLTSIPPVSAVFNCLGTTRGAAGSAEAFVAVEVGLSRYATRLAEQAGVLHISAVAAEGAKSDVPVPGFLTARSLVAAEAGRDDSYLMNLGALHPLLYMRTLGQKADLIANSTVPSRSVFAPGMLNRLTNDRLWENVVNALNIGLSVNTLARAMVKDAEDALLAREGECADTRVYSSNKVIEAYANA